MTNKVQSLLLELLLLRVKYSDREISQAASMLHNYQNSEELTKIISTLKKIEGLGPGDRGKYTKASGQKRSTRNKDRSAESIQKNLLSASREDLEEIGKAFGLPKLPNDKAEAIKEIRDQMKRFPHSHVYEILQNIIRTRHTSEEFLALAKEIMQD